MGKNVVIVGGGLGGLTAGALLAKRGFSVTLVEKHTVVGGCATLFFRRGGYACEVGLHEMDNVYRDPFKKEIFEELGVYDAIEFVKVPEFYRVQTEDFGFVMPSSLHEAREALVQRFRHERGGIGRYFALIEEVAKGMRALRRLAPADLLSFPRRFGTLFGYRNRSVAEVMAKLFSDERVKLLLNANIGYYHDAPSELAFLFHAQAQYSYFEGGGWYIRGGSQKLSDHLASVILRNGGEIIRRAEAVSIGHGRVLCRRKGWEFDLPCDIVVSNLSPADTYRLCGLHHRENRPVGTSLFTLYLGFKKSLRSVFGPQPYANFFPGAAKTLADFETIRRTPLEQRGFCFVDYSRIKSALTPPEKSFGVVVTYDRMATWEGLGLEAYRAKKERMSDRFVEKLEKHYPGIGALIEYREAATPRTIRRYIGTPEGTAYGFAPLKGYGLGRPRVRSRLRPDLFFVGQWVLGGGFTPAIHSAKLACDAVVKAYE